MTTPLLIPKWLESYNQGLTHPAFDVPLGGHRYRESDSVYAGDQYSKIDNLLNHIEYIDFTRMSFWQ